MAHTIRCAHDDCDEYSLRAACRPTPREQEAADHRRSLAADGWSDIEGRDYCPDHSPRAASDESDEPDDECSRGECLGIHQSADGYRDCDGNTI